MLLVVETVLDGLIGFDEELLEKGFLGEAAVAGQATESKVGVAFEPGVELVLSVFFGCCSSSFVSGLAFGVG